MGEFTVGSYAVIRNGRDEVLLTKRRDGDEWVLPGGTVEQDEPPWDALLREVREETGLAVEVERLVGVYAKKREADLVFVFRASIADGELRASDERESVRFFPEEALPDETSDRERERIADEGRNDEYAFLRVQPSQSETPPPGTR